MQNKQNLILEIENLPEYELKSIYVENEEEFKKAGDRFKAVTEIDKTEAVSIVTNIYKLTQFKEVFLPIVKGINELEGEIKFYKGKGILVVFPEGDEFKLDNGNKIGLAIFNSVTKEFAILIDFVVLYNNTEVYLPRKVGAFRSKHLGKVKDLIKDYGYILTKVKESWKVISDKFSREIDQDDYNNILEKLNLGKRTEKKLNEIYDFNEIKNEEGVTVGTTNYKLWDLFLDIINKVSKRKYKNELNKVKKLKTISNTIYEFAILESI